LAGKKAATSTMERVRRDILHHDGMTYGAPLGAAQGFG
jgi:hypothetical protein